MENVLRLIHYSQKEANAFESMNNVAEVVGSDFFDGFQLNMAWPKLDSIIEYKRKYPEHKIVLQVGTRSFTYFNEDMERVAKEIQRYDPFVDYILFDFSGGKGILMDSRFVSMNISRIVNKYNIQQNKIVIAGGISPDNMEEIIIPILREFPFIGIDSESRLRNNEDDLDISLVREYLSKFEELKQRIRTK
jgi:phosphoribosylanthranilate isomerase